MHYKYCKITQKEAYKSANNSFFKIMYKRLYLNDIKLTNYYG